MNEIPKDMFDSLRHIAEQGKIFKHQLEWHAWAKKNGQYDSLMISIPNQSESSQVQHYQDISA